MVLVPSENPDDGQAPTTDEPAEPWVFPFDKPLPPAEGDNQAAAYNTTDDSMTYDVAFALVWATGDEVLNVNEAHAYASCSNCVTVAVAFQVVLIMDDAHVVVPQNLAVAANYECYRCITAAIASQLVLSLEEVPGTEQLLPLGAIWNQLTEFGQSITSYPLSEVSAQLEEFKARSSRSSAARHRCRPTRRRRPHPRRRPPARRPPAATSRRRPASPHHPRRAQPATSEPTTNEPTSEPTTEPTTAPPSPEPTTAPAEPSPSPTP